jgi:hypothetical protein
VVWSEVVVALLLAAGLLALAVYFGWRQIVSLRQMPLMPMSDDERRYERRKAWRRLVSCALMLLMAGLLIGLQFYAGRAQELADERAQLERDNDPELTPQEKVFVRIYAGSWIAVMLLLLVVLTLAGLDLWATRLYGLRQYRKISEDRRAMIQRQVNRLRQERNGDA